MKGKRSVEDARQFYAKTAMEAMKGQMSPYTQRLQFSPSLRTADVDTPAKDTMLKDQEKERVSSDVD